MLPRRWPLVAAVLLGILTACSNARKVRRTRSEDPRGVPAAVAVGNLTSEGGTLTVSYGALQGTLIEIPPGALTGSARIVVSEGTQASELPSGIVAAGPVVSFGPEGQTFARPVTVTLPTTREAHLVLTRAQGAKSWTPVMGGRYDAARHVMVVEVTHFSDYLTAGIDSVGYLLHGNSAETAYTCQFRCMATLIAPNMALTSRSCLEFYQQVIQKRDAPVDDATLKADTNWAFGIGAPGNNDGTNQNAICANTYITGQDAPVYYLYNVSEIALPIPSGDADLALLILSRAVSNVVPWSVGPNVDRRAFRESLLGYYGLKSSAAGLSTISISSADISNENVVNERQRQIDMGERKLGLVIEHSLCATNSPQKIYLHDPYNPAAFSDTSYVLNLMGAPLLMVTANPMKQAWSPTLAIVAGRGNSHSTECAADATKGPAIVATLLDSSWGWIASTVCRATKSVSCWDETLKSYYDKRFMSQFGCQDPPPRSCTTGSAPFDIDVTSVEVTSTNGQPPTKGDGLKVTMTVKNSGTVARTAKLVPILESERFKDFVAVPLGEVIVTLEANEQKQEAVTTSVFLTDPVAKKHYALGSGDYLIKFVSIEYDGQVVNDSKFTGGAFTVATSNAILVVQFADDRFLERDGHAGENLGDYFVRAITHPSELFDPDKVEKSEPYFGSSPDAPLLGGYERFEGGFVQMMGVSMVIASFTGWQSTPLFNDNRSQVLDSFRKYAGTTLGLEGIWHNCNGNPPCTMQENHGFDLAVGLGVAGANIDAEGQAGSEVSSVMMASSIPFKDTWLTINHEMGHVFGADHCDHPKYANPPLSGYVMCYGQLHAHYIIGNFRTFVWHKVSRDRMKNPFN